MRIPVGPAVREARRVQPAGGGWLAFAGTMVLVCAIVDGVYGIVLAMLKGTVAL
jgi:hypothetical protein